MKPSLPKISYLNRCPSTHCSQAVTLAFTLVTEHAACLRVQTAILGEFAFKPLLLHTLLNHVKVKLLLLLTGKLSFLTKVNCILSPISPSKKMRPLDVVVQLVIKK